MTQSIEELAVCVKDFRQALLDAGFVHANATGEIMSSDGVIWIGTGYSGGEYQLNTWLRPSGSGVHEREFKWRLHKGRENLMSELLEIHRALLSTDRQPREVLSTWWDDLEALHLAWED